jgi:hypothetical protein
MQFAPFRVLATTRNHIDPNIVKKSPRPLQSTSTLFFPSPEGYLEMRFLAARFARRIVSTLAKLVRLRLEKTVWCESVGMMEKEASLDSQ